MDDLPVFVAVVDRNGITAAAKTLGMPKSTVSAALARLEAGLGLRLLERNSRSVRVTGEGETFYRQAQLILEQVRETDAAMAGL
ncbi:LysR family transcriptional regulator, partial [Oceanicola sp. S124]|uniref:LysR family transcriptional regulator n=1 Tax=Oceanicola sp. S124 TaxID=1042378 RepID=UPI0002559107